MADESSSFADRLAALRQDYLGSLPEKFAAIRREWQAHREHLTFDAETLFALRAEVHKLVGSGGAFGFGELSELMKNIEMKVDALPDSGDYAVEIIKDIDDLLIEMDAWEARQNLR